jgi:hypothetical protein
VSFVIRGQRTSTFGVALGVDEPGTEFMIVHFPYRGPDLRDTTETEKDTDNLEDREKREKFARSRFHACPRAR